MDAVIILGQSVPFTLLIGANPGDETMDRDALRTALAAMAQAINAVNWPGDYAGTFAAMKQITFFTGAVPYQGAMLTRPFTDQANANFYWHALEFDEDYDPATRASYFFHDCRHVAQYQADGGPAADLDEAVGREVDAVNWQVQAATSLGCRPEVIEFLREYGGNDQEIRARLAEGFTPAAACTACRPVATA